MDRVSYMLAVPADEKELEDPERLIQRLKEAEFLTVLKAETGNEEIGLEAVYNETLYKATMYPTKFELPELYRMQHFFPDMDIEAIEEKSIGLAVEMEFSGDATASYHLQLKLIDIMFSCVLAVMDDSSEKILSGRWVALAASSHVPPSPRYLYTVQAVAEEGTDVWLHTHGLNRCGCTELEILHSDQENYGSHYHVIETMANRLLEMDEPLEEGEPLFLARLSSEVLLVTTLLSWEKAVELYHQELDGEEFLGSAEDRGEGHNKDTSCIFTYPSQKDLEEGVMAPVSIYDEILADNPVYMISTKETERMKALALERVSYIKQMAGEPETTILVKLGLTVDDENKADGNEKEHIWFELQEISDLTLKAELTQEPYYISDLHEGHIGEYSIDMITDWVIFRKEQKISPDDVYILDLL